MRAWGTMLITTNLDECAEFYGHLLGVRPQHGAGWAEFTLEDGSRLALHTPWQEGMESRGGSQVWLLQVASVADEAARLANHGIECSAPHDIPGGSVVTVVDPDGRLIQLVELKGYDR